VPRQTLILDRSDDAMDPLDVQPADGSERSNEA
jgi:hypothetical protein